jgi:hypothetical protein
VLRGQLRGQTRYDLAVAEDERLARIERDVWLLEAAS